jgi:hypothetical protein
MCAGISFIDEKIKLAELKRFLTPEELKKQRQDGVSQTFFWQAKPFLPVEENGEVHLYDWGNRDKAVDLPKTGWTKIESLEKGTWNWLKPEMVRIPSLKGYEKKHWFATPGGVQGIKVKQGTKTRVYMLTMPATKNYLNLTGHDRMPIIIKK